jgi:hypothetical protein
MLIFFFNYIFSSEIIKMKIWVVLSDSIICMYQQMSAKKKNIAEVYIFVMQCKIISAR